MAFASFVLAIPFLLLPRRSSDKALTDPAKSKSFHHLLPENRAWKEPAFVSYLFANFFILIGFYIPWLYIPSFA